MHAVLVFTCLALVNGGEYLLSSSPLPYAFPLRVSGLSPLQFSVSPKVDSKIHVGAPSTLVPTAYVVGGNELGGQPLVYTFDSTIAGDRNTNQYAPIQYAYILQSFNGVSASGHPQIYFVDPTAGAMVDDVVDNTVQSTRGQTNVMEQTKYPTGDSIYTSDVKSSFQGAATVVPRTETSDLKDAPAATTSYTSESKSRPESLPIVKSNLKIDSSNYVSGTVIYLTNPNMVYSADGTPMSNSADSTPMSNSADGKPMSYNADGTPMSYSAGGTLLTLSAGSVPMKYNADDTPMSYNDDGTPMSYNADETPMSYNADDTAMSHNADGKPMFYNADDTPMSYIAGDKSYLITASARSEPIDVSPMLYSSEVKVRAFATNPLPGYVAQNPGVTHRADLPEGLGYASHHINLQPAPGTK